MFTFVSNLFNYPTPPDVVSTSWMWAESDQCGGTANETVCHQPGVDSRGYIERTTISNI